MALDQRLTASLQTFATEGQKELMQWKYVTFIGDSSWGQKQTEHQLLDVGPTQFATTHWGSGKVLTADFWRAAEAQCPQ